MSNECTNRLSERKQHVERESSNGFGERAFSSLPSLPGHTLVRQINQNKKIGVANMRNIKTFLNDIESAVRNFEAAMTISPGLAIAKFESAIHQVAQGFIAHSIINE